MKFKIFFNAAFAGLLCMLGVHTSYAESFAVRSITLEGNDRTDADVIREEIAIKEGSTNVSEKNIADAENDILLLGIFSEAKIEKSATESPDTFDLKIKVIEKWTTIPIAKFTSGGGVQQTILGVFDPNIGGKYLEAGLQLESLEGTNSGVVWFKNPRLFAKKQSIDIQIWRENRLRTKYETDMIQPVIKTGFLHVRNKIYLAYMEEIYPNLEAGYSFEYNDDSFTDQFLRKEVKQKVETTGLPPQTKTNLYGYEIKYAKLQNKNLREFGRSVLTRFRYANILEGDFNDFTQVELAVTQKSKIWHHLDLALQVAAGYTNTQVLQYWYYLGGLSHVRGFKENRFAGNKFWQSNLELRYMVYTHPWVALQPILFWDQAAASDVLPGLRSPSGSSIGGGLRLMSPRIYRLAVRLDYAKPLVKNDTESVSFGIQQFF